jgi:tetratricopeptide (TPR) repeat protein
VSTRGDTSASSGLAGTGVALAAILAVKLLVVWQLKDHPLTQPDVGLDTQAYADLARQAVAGNWALGPGLYFVSPLYIYFLAAGLAVTGSFTAIRIVQVVLGAAAVGLIYLTARRWYGVRAGVLAALCAACTGLFTFYESLILQAAIDPFLAAAALFLLSGDGGVSQIATGVVLGLAGLNRPNALLAALMLLAVLAVLRQAKRAAWIVLGMSLALAPVAARNLVVSGQATLASSHGGLNFYIGNHAQATGVYTAVPGITPNIAGQAEDARRVAESALGRPLNDAEVSDYFWNQAWSWIGQHPGAALRLLARKLYYALHAQHVALPYSYPFYVHDADTALAWLPVGPWLLVPLGLVGLVAAAPPKPRERYVAWAAFVPCYLFAVAAFFHAERYRLPLLVAFAITSGGALDVAWRAVAERRWRAVAAGAAAVLALGIALGWPIAPRDGRWDERLRMAEQLIILERYDEADVWAERLDGGLRPGWAGYVLGRQLLFKNQTARALAHLERAVEEARGSEPAAVFLFGQALVAAGRVEAARAHLDAGAAAGADGSADPETWLRLGRQASAARALADAEALFTRAVELGPALASARQQLGLNLVLQSAWPRAAAELAEAVRLDPKNADSLAYLALAEINVGRMGEARIHAAAALVIQPDHDVARKVAAAAR